MIGSFGLFLRKCMIWPSQNDHSLSVILSNKNGVSCKELLVHLSINNKTITIIIIIIITIIINNHTCVFLGGNHYSLGFSRSALWILPTISHRILKRCISLTKKMWKPQDRDLIKLRIFNALRTVLSETVPLNPPFTVGAWWWKVQWLSVHLVPLP